jgi:hypothetical protein
LLALAVVVYMVALAVAACRRAPSTSEEEETVLPASATNAPVRHLMAGVVDPAADVVWNAVATIMTLEGTNEHEPKTDEEWADVRRNALMLKQSADLLLTPGRPIAGPGEKSIAPGIELEPEEIFANVAKDREKWDHLVHEYRAATDDVLAAVAAKDAERLFDIGDDLDATCENCHIAFWYPNQVLPPGYEEPPPMKQSQ